MMTANLTLMGVVGVFAACGVYMLLERSIIKMLLGLLLIGNAINLLILTLSGPSGKAPIVGTESDLHEDMADPLAQAMILTSIVITMGIAAFVLALTYRSYTFRARDEIENDPEDTLVSRRRSPAEAPVRDRSDDPLTREPEAVAGDVAEGLGFAIPVDTVKTISQQLIRSGQVARPFLGVSVRPVNRSISSYYDLRDENGNLLETGVLVVEVSPRTAAAQAGLQAGDVILKLNDIELGEDQPLANALTQFKPGDTVTLTIVRDARTQQVQVTLGSRPTGTP